MNWFLVVINTFLFAIIFALGDALVMNGGRLEKKHYFNIFGALTISIVVYLILGVGFGW